MQMQDDLALPGVYGDDNAADTTALSAATTVTPATMYAADATDSLTALEASVAAAIAAVVAGSGAAVFVDMQYRDAEFPKMSSARPTRVNLFMGIKEADAAASTVNENGYLVIATNLGGVEGIRLERAYTALWTRTASQADQIPTTAGGRTGLCWASTVVLSNTGLLLARTGAEMATNATAQVPAAATILDVGNAVGILRVLDSGATVPDGYVPIHDVWR
jgi:hypothetical protein